MKAIPENAPSEGRFPGAAMERFPEDERPSGTIAGRGSVDADMSEPGRANYLAAAMSAD